jgi:hypothetical protein
MQEPKDGDFVAYIEALQRESAARLEQQHVVVHEADGSPKYGSAFSQQGKATTPVRLEQSIERVLRADSQGQLVRALVATVVGAMLLLSGLGNGGLLFLVAGIALLAYGAPRLFRTFRALGTPEANRARIEQVFGRSGTQGRETKR